LVLGLSPSGRHSHIGTYKHQELKWLGAKNIISFDNSKYNIRNLIKILGGYRRRYSPAFIRDVRSLNHLVLGNHVSQLGRTRSAWLSCARGFPKSKNILFEEALTNKFFQVPLEASVVGGHMVKIIVFRSESAQSCWIGFGALLMVGP